MVDVHGVLKRAMLATTAPIFLIQAENDYNLGPSQYLGPVLDGKGGLNRHKLYPEFKPELGHKSGHGLNNRLLRALQADPSAWEEVVFERPDQAPISYVQALSIPSTALAS